MNDYFLYSVPKILRYVEAREEAAQCEYLANLWDNDFLFLMLRLRRQARPYEEW